MPQGDTDVSHMLRLFGLGANVDVVCDGPKAEVLTELMSNAWSRCIVDAPVAGTPTAEPVHVVGDEDAEALAPLLMRTTQLITHALIAAQAGHLLMLHAGAVCDPDTGNSLIFVAPGGTGKTTLSRRLGTRCGYLTDETVGISADSLILPYPKPLSVRRDDHQGLKDEVSPDTLGLLPAGSTPRAHRIIVLERRAGITSPLVEELTTMDAIFELVPQSSSLPRLVKPLHHLADAIESYGPVLRFIYDESSQVEDALLDLIGGRP